MFNDFLLNKRIVYRTKTYYGLYFKYTCIFDNLKKTLEGYRRQKKMEEQSEEPRDYIFFLSEKKKFNF